ncbi:neuropeptide receptor npr-1-like [Ostrea edulis]|uniref:neuropeptide receptor npr-1-like n=1 Tax=Ostrea edulis TaxID=37623 RepID=UPI00209415EB|nr:neuropeptide receptor npr-1-like [Ostrea edulis]
MLNFSVNLLNEEYIIRNIPNAVVLVLYIVVGILGNISVLIVYVRDMKNVFGSGRLFIPFMAFADLVTLIFNGGVEFNTEIQPFQESADNAIECKMTRFFGLVLVVTSGCVYFAIAVHRYVLICRPHSKEMTRKWKFIIIISTSIFIFGVSIPKYIFYGSTVVTMESERIPNQTVMAYVCGTEEEFENKLSSNIYLYILTINSFIWSSALAVLYTFVGNRIRQRNKEAISKSYSAEEVSCSPSTDSSRRDRDHEPKQKPRLIKQMTAGSITTFITNNRLTWMFILMTVLNVVSYIPKLVLDISYNQDRYFFFKKEKNMYLMLMFLDNFYLFNNVANPFIYGFFDAEFRNRFKKRFCSYCR